jgi:hypothetical protein
VRRVFGWAISAVVAAGWLFAVLPCNAEARCPWLNAATAGGVLGGNVEMTVTEPVDPGPVKGVGTAMYSDQVRMDRFDVSCEFSRKVDSGVYSLRIQVKTMNDFSKEFPALVAQCAGTTVALKGIGNEAVQCVMKNGSEEGHEQVIARVRDRSFVLTISRAKGSQAAADESTLSNETRNTAEQIAGSLF